jgi:hypothetical protein
MKTTYLLLALPALFLVGCSTAVSPKEAARIDPQKTGLVLATIYQAGEKDTWLDFTLHSLDGHDSSFLYPSIKPTQGLWLVEVPAGRYQLENWVIAERWTITEGPDPSEAGQSWITPRVEFEVKPGEITYLGHFEVPDHRSQRPILLVDWHKKGIALFRQRYPALADMPVRLVAPEQIALVRSFENYVANFPVNASFRDYPAPMPTGPKFPAP